MASQWQGLVAAALLGLAAAPAVAEDSIKIGVIAPLSGPFADSGDQLLRGLDTYMSQHGDSVGGRKIEQLRRDSAGDPATAKRLAQELVTRDKVDFLAGFVFTPEVLSVAPVGTEAHTPMVIMNAAGRPITEKSPYLVRFSYAQDILAAKMGEWAPKNGITKVYTAVADFSTGYESEAAFGKAFAQAGGTLVGAIRMPLANPDFAAYVQRIADARPEAVYLFVPSPQPKDFIRQFIDLGLKGAGTKLISGTGIVDTNVKNALGDAVTGILTTMVYSEAHPTALNRRFVADYQALFGTNLEPNYVAVGAYDGLAAIYQVVAKLGGAIDGDKAMEAFKGMSFESPRGPIAIDPETRDITESIYIRRVEPSDSGLVNREIYEFPKIRVPH